MAAPTNTDFMDYHTIKMQLFNMVFHKITCI